MGGISWWGNCLEGTCPGGNYSRLIVQPEKACRIIILGGNFMEVIIWGDYVTGGIIQV